MPPYAYRTKVPVDNSIAEIKKTIRRYGAEGIMVGEGPAKHSVMFRYQERHIKFVIDVEGADDRELRRLWRCLVLVIKSKLESVSTGIVTFEEEFLAHIVLPDGKTIGQAIAPQIESTYQTGKMPTLLEDLRG